MAPSISGPEERAREIIAILKNSQHHPYIGEAVTQAEHMLQAAHWAMKQKLSTEVILACLLHDIGHVLDVDSPQMANSAGQSYGAQHHETIGANFLLSKGFSKSIATMVGNHVLAKRYLVWKRGKEYIASLSGASVETLKHQGGILSDEQARNFEKDPLFAMCIKVREADEQAKISPHPNDCPTFEYFHQMIVEHLCDN